MGNMDEWTKLAVKGLDCLMSFVLNTDKYNKIFVQIDHDIEFCTCYFGLKSIRREDLKGDFKYCDIVDYNYKLTDDNKKQLVTVYPNFCLTHFTKWVRKRHSHSPDHTDYFGPEDMILMRETIYN